MTNEQVESFGIILLKGGLKLNRILSLLFLSIFSAAAYADLWTFESGSKRVQLIELFTSQGCSSCPPAEKWMNNLLDHPGLWESFVPVAFHVDYWDYLGWKDPYSRQKYSKRQRLHRQFLNVSSVYTPGFLINGREWKGFFVGDSPRFIKGAAPNLKVSVDDKKIKVKMEGANDLFTVNVAVLGFGLNDAVTSGENGGRQLKGEFIVLEFKQSTSSKGEWVVNLPSRINIGETEKLALAVWVTDPFQRPIQSAGQWAPKHWIQ